MLSNLLGRSASVEKQIAKARAHRDTLAERLEAAKATVPLRQEAVKKLALEAADDDAIEAATAEVHKAEQIVVARTGALAAADATVVELEYERDEQIAEKLRQTSATEIDVVRADVDAIGKEFMAVIARMSDIGDRAGRIISEGNGLRIASDRLRGNVPDAVGEVLDLLERKRNAILRGVEAPILKNPPPPTPKPEPIALKRIFALHSMQWTEGNNIKTCARNGQADMPIAVANRALSLGYAYELSDHRVKYSAAGFTAPPNPGPHLIDLDDPKLKPARPLFGIDIAKADADMRETVGGNQSWINAGRGEHG